MRSVICFFMFVLVVLPASVIALPVKIQWIPSEERAVQIASDLEAGVAKECFGAGLELEHRFLLKFCKKVNRFGTSCGETRKEVHNISFDPIQEAYRVVKDRLGDKEDPVVQSVSELDEALVVAGAIDRLPLSFVEDSAESDSPLSGASEHESLLGMRIRTTCKGELSEIFVDISYFLSFGLVDLYGYDSGWEYYELSGSGAALSRK